MCKQISLIIAISLIVPLLPLIINGAPMIGDSWVHLKISEETVKTGKYSLNEYNERWPLVNFILIFMTLIPNFKGLKLMLVIPLLVGLSIIPLYCLCRRLGLSKISSAFSTFFLSFCTLYTYITFAGAIMKETSTFFLIMLIPLLAILARNVKDTKALSITFLIVSIGIALGHHFAGLFALLFLSSFSSYLLFERLRGENIKLKNIFIPFIIYFSIFFIWNVMNYFALGPYFPVFNVRDFLLLLSSYFIIWFSLYKVKRFAWSLPASFLIAVFGLRGGIYTLAQHFEPISYWEVRDWIVIGLISLIGLSLAMKNVNVKSFVVSSSTLIIFSFIFGFSYPGFTLLIKSMHYFTPLLAIGSGFTVSRIMKKGIMGKIIIILLILFLIHISWFGTYQALNGPAAYKQQEIKEIIGLQEISKHFVLTTDLRYRYLLPYLINKNPSSINFMKEPSKNRLIMLSKFNMEHGILAGYDWIPTKALLPSQKDWNKVLDTPYLILLCW